VETYKLNRGPLDVKCTAEMKPNTTMEFNKKTPASMVQYSRKPPPLLSPLSTVPPNPLGISNTACEISTSNKRMGRWQEGRRRPSSGGYGGQVVPILGEFIPKCQAAQIRIHASLQNRPQRGDECRSAAMEAARNFCVPVK
jgi:hypothetical protein